MPNLQTLIIEIKQTLADTPTNDLSKGFFIRDGFDSQVDELRHFIQNSKSFLAEYQQKLKVELGVDKLKISFNNVFGYYIEITKNQAKNLKDHPDLVRKQTLVNCERYITPQLKEFEDKILNAENELITKENTIYQNLIKKISTHFAEIQTVSEKIAAIDVDSSLASLALKNDYHKPTITDKEELEIKEGRHPVIEQISDSYVANDLQLDNDQQLILLTGANMSGKSSYLRQNALIILLSHIGSFIPAKQAIIPETDRIFCRVGASDNLAEKQSTFMVEMQESANIVNNATSKSFIILDEIGRGTATYDGLSIAWAIIEHLHNKIGAKTLFATHYHELVELTTTLDKAHNYSVAISENGEQIIFLYKIVPGANIKSYGIEVAKLAGFPKEVIQSAYKLLSKLENDENQKINQIQKRVAVKDDFLQYSLFNNQSNTSSTPPIEILNTPSVIEEKVKKMNLNNITPLEALNLLNELKKEVE